MNRPVSCRWQFRPLLLFIVCIACGLSAATAAGGDGAAATQTKVMFIGDSITFGKAYNFRFLLWRKLREAGYTQVDFVGRQKTQAYFGDYDPDHESFGGKPADFVRDRTARSIAEIKPDIAVIHLSTNDYWQQAQPRIKWNKSKNAFDYPQDAGPQQTVSEIGEIVANLQKANPNVNVLIAKFEIPYCYRFWLKGLHEGIDTLAAETSTDASTVQTLDLVTDWNHDPRNRHVSLKYDGKLDHDFDTQDKDGAHPSTAGSLKIANRVYDAITPWIGKPAGKPQPYDWQDPPSLSQGAEASADSVSGPYEPNRAVDGDVLTSWVADDKQPGHALTVDLGAAQSVKGTAIYWWTNGNAYSYTIDVSGDGKKWTTVVDKTQGKPRQLAVALRGQYDKFDAEGVRFIRVANINIHNEHWSGAKPGISEFRAFSKAVADPASAVMRESQTEGTHVEPGHKPDEPEPQPRVTFNKKPPKPARTHPPLPVNSNATDEAAAVLAYVSSYSNETFNGVIVGQNCGHGDEMPRQHKQLVEKLHEDTGKWVGMLGIDYEFIRRYSLSDLSKANGYLIDHWNKGGLVTVNVTPVNPFHHKGNVFKTEDVDMRKLLDPTSDKHEAWMASLDHWAAALGELQEAGVVVLWRPMQEPNGRHFWYGRNSAGNERGDVYRLLYRHMHDYFTREKKLNNLLWVYSPVGGGDDVCYPGDEYVDIVGGTQYEKELTIWGYTKAMTYDKTYGMNEYGHNYKNAPGDFDMRKYVENIKARFPRVAYWVSWHNWGDTHMAIVSNEHAREMMNSDDVITRDEIDWKSWLPKVRELRQD